MLSMFLTPAVLGSIVRHLMTTAGGSLIVSGYVSSDQWTQITGAAVTIAGIVLGILNKKK